MVVESSRNKILCDDDTVKIQLECYITKDNDLDEIIDVAPSSRALNISNGDIWILMDDNKWHKYKTEDVREAVI